MSEEKQYYKITTIVAVFVLVLVATWGYTAYTHSLPALETQSFDIQIASVDKEEPEPALLLSISSLLLEQGDTLLIQVENISSGAEISGSFERKKESEKLSFFSLDSTTRAAIVGIDAKAVSGTYILSVQMGGEKIITEITVLKKNFPVTELVITDKLEEQGYTPSSIASDIVGKENPSISDVIQKHTPIAYFDEEFIYPLGTALVVGAFGNIRKQGDSAIQHMGVDLDADIATPVYSINDGMVVLKRTFTTYGNTLIIDHGLGVYSLYLHLNGFNVDNGERVVRGQIVGYSGNSGYSISPHLHFSVKVNGARVDPLRFIDTMRGI